MFIDFIFLGIVILLISLSFVFIELCQKLSQGESE